jgi:hypothetical protein
MARHDGRFQPATKYKSPRLAPPQFFDFIFYFPTSRRGAFEGLVDLPFISPTVRTCVPFTIAGAGVAIQSSVRIAGGCTGYIVCALGRRRIIVSSFVSRPVQVPVYYGVTWAVAVYT